MEKSWNSVPVSLTHVRCTIYPCNCSGPRKLGSHGPDLSRFSRPPPLLKPQLSVRALLPPQMVWLLISQSKSNQPSAFYANPMNNRYARLLPFPPSENSTPPNSDHLCVRVLHFSLPASIPDGSPATITAASSSVPFCSSNDFPSA